MSLNLKIWEEAGPDLTEHVGEADPGQELWQSLRCHGVPCISQGFPPTSTSPPGWTSSSSPSAPAPPSLQALSVTLSRWQGSRTSPPWSPWPGGSSCSSVLLYPDSVYPHQACLERSPATTSGGRYIWSKQDSVRKVPTSGATAPSWCPPPGRSFSFSTLQSLTLSAFPSPATWPPPSSPSPRSTTWLSEGCSSLWRSGRWISWRPALPVKRMTWCSLWWRRSTVCSWRVIVHRFQGWSIWQV